MKNQTLKINKPEKETVKDPGIKKIDTLKIPEIDYTKAFKAECVISNKLAKEVAELKRVIKPREKNHAKLINDYNKLASDLGKNISTLQGELETTKGNLRISESEIKHLRSVIDSGSNRIHNLNIDLANQRAKSLFTIIIEKIKN